MDVFRFMNPTNPTLLDQGQLINGIKSKLWIERYRDAGEFLFVANVSKNVQELLPIGSLISHIETSEVMMVENHEINEEKGKEPEIKISGRSFETYLDNRIVGTNKNWPTSASASEEFSISSANTWHQIVYLIKNHVDVAFTIDDDDALEYVEVLTDVVSTGEQTERVIKRGSLYTRVMELLAIDDLGIKVVRPGPNSPLGWESNKTAIVIHKGQLLVPDVALSYNTGEIETADYLWSDKKFKNSALVTSTWLETVVKNGSGLNRRWMFVDYSDLDDVYESEPSEPEKEVLLLYMYVQGQIALYYQKEVAIIKAESTKNSLIHKYREDYNIGDIVLVKGQYREVAAMRVDEYVEIEDETGQSGYPTLSLI